jgi:hypothetical protein
MASLATPVLFASVQTQAEAEIDIELYYTVLPRIKWRHGQLVGSRCILDLADSLYRRAAYRDSPHETLCYPVLGDVSRRPVALGQIAMEYCNHCSE